MKGMIFTEFLAIRNYGEPIDPEVEDLSGGKGTAVRFRLTRRAGR